MHAHFWLKIFAFLFFCMIKEDNLNCIISNCIEMFFFNLFIINIQVVYCFVIPSFIAIISIAWIKYCEISRSSATMFVAFKYIEFQDHRCMLLHRTIYKYSLNVAAHFTFDESFWLHKWLEGQRCTFESVSMWRQCLGMYVLYKPRHRLQCTMRLKCIRELLFLFQAMSQNSFTHAVRKNRKKSA